MREGVNKSKTAPKLDTSNYHRVIVPVYIPNLEEDYYRDGLQILEYALVSLFRTTHSKTRVTIINNGSCAEVVEFLYALKSKYESFDQIYDCKSNLGKVNAINAVLKGNLEQLITITDADVLFLENWQEGVEHVFASFPEAGVVSPVPSSIGYTNLHTSSTLGYAVLKSRLVFSDVLDPSGLINFQKSIGRSMYKEAHLKQWPTYSFKGNKAVIGCGHFCATFKRQALLNIPNKPSQYKLGMGAVAQYLDRPANQDGYLRLATQKNMAYHLGNKIEKWMGNAVPGEDGKTSFTDPKLLHLSSIGVSKSYRLFGNFISRLFKKYPKIKMWYFKRKGLKYNYY